MTVEPQLGARIYLDLNERIMLQRLLVFNTLIELPVVGVIEYYLGMYKDLDTSYCLVPPETRHVEGLREILSNVVDDPHNMAHHKTTVAMGVELLEALRAKE